MTVMRVPLSWLNDYVDVSDIPVEELAERLTLAGLEVERIERIGAHWERDKMFVGEILEITPHPNADRLVLATIEYGGERPMTVVTGAPNIKVGDRGQKVAFATVGATLFDPYSDEPGKTFKLKASKIRGVRSEGMACSERELGIGEDHTGILLLPDDAPVGMPLVDYLGDVVLHFDVTPNMARCLSVIGVAREVAALYGRPLKREVKQLAEIEGIVAPTDMPRPPAPAEPFCRIEIADPDLCARYCATLIKGVKVGPSPRWMQQRLIRAGMRPINNIVDVTNYVMLEWGQPLHAFDYDVLVQRARRGRESSDQESVIPTIIVRRAKPGEKITTLDGVERDLTPDMLLIADTAGPIAIAGVMGGAETEVWEGTVNVLLESANFDYINNRRTSQALKLPSEASARFSKGIPAEMPVPAALRASELMVELAGGQLVPGVADGYPAPQETRVVTITPAEVKRILGMDVPVEEMVRILEALEFEVETGNWKLEARSSKLDMEPASSSEYRASSIELRVTVPWHRLDVTIPADLIEEIARVIGYDKIPTTLMADYLPPQRRNWVLEGTERVRDILVGCGLQDIITYSFISDEYGRKLLAALPEPEAGYTKQEARSKRQETRGKGQEARSKRQEEGYPIPCILHPAACIRIANPITSERVIMRSTLLDSALATLANNLRYAQRVAVFEIGRVFWPQEGELLPHEPLHLSIALSGPRNPGNWLGSDPEPMDFFDLKGIIETLLARLGIEAATYVPIEHPTFHPGRAAELRLPTFSRQPIGILGEVHPAVRRAYDLPEQRVCAAELVLAPFIEAVKAATKRRLVPISSFPAVHEDIALVVDEAVTAEQMERAIRAAGGRLLREVRLFDVYRGTPVPEGKKSMAYALTFQSDTKTLKDAEVARLRQRIVRRLERELGAVLRA